MGTNFCVRISAGLYFLSLLFLNLQDMSLSRSARETCYTIQRLSESVFTGPVIIDGCEFLGL